MFEELCTTDRGTASKSQLLEIISKYDFDDENGGLYLDNIICSLACDDEVFIAIFAKAMKNRHFHTLINSLDKETLDFMAYKDITSIEAISAGIQVFKDNPNFMPKIKENSKYSLYQDQQSLAIKLFNIEFLDLITQIQGANNLKDLDTIIAARKDLEQKRESLLQTYPLAAPFNMSEIFDEEEKAKNRIDLVERASIDVSNAKSSLYNPDGSKSDKCLIGWESFKTAKLNLNGLLIRRNEALKQTEKRKVSL